MNPAFGHCFGRACWAIYLHEPLESERGRMGKRPRRVKLADVAEAANVSVSTVSRLMTGKTVITPDNRERILKAAVRLGFEIEKRNRSKIIAFVLSNRGVLHPFHSAVLMGAEAYCAEHDYGLLFLPMRYSGKVPWQELRLPEILQRRQLISGVIVAGTNSQNLLELLTRKGMPAVVLGNNVMGSWQPPKASAVYFDDIGGAHEVTRYLQSLGHQQIGFVGNRQLPWFARRYEGYKKAMEEAHLDLHVSEVKSTDDEELGYLATKLILQQPVAVTAVFAGDDAAARGAYKAARDSGLNIPGDLSIAGFNDTSDSSALHPPLTSVRVFTAQLGSQLAESLLEQIGRPDLPPRLVTLPTQLVRRESCGPPNKLSAVSNQQSAISKQG
jgi:DNA-binding LacI/PurR family transcriptional regulator